MRLTPNLSFLLLACWGVDSAVAQHAGDILIGRTDGKQMVATQLPGRTVYLPAVQSGAFRGWVSSVLGFDGAVSLDPAGQVLPLEPGANVFLEVVTIDPGLSLRSFTAPATVFVDEPGERLRIGSTGNLHNHPIVFIDSAVVGTHFTGDRAVTFRLVDLGTAAHAVSPEYSVTFSPVLATRLSIVRTGGGTTISFEALKGLAYQIEAAPRANGPWLKEGGFIAGTGTTARFTSGATSSNLFFRAQSFPDN